MGIKRNFAWALLTGLMMLSGCHQTLSYTYMGHVIDENGQAIANASIHMADLATTSNASGAFAFKTSSPNVLVSVSAAGYSTVTKPLGIKSPSGNLMLFQLRALDVNTVVDLPSGSDAELVLPIVRSNSQMALHIPADSMVLPDGSVAHGSARVTMSYWDPTESMATAPGALLADPQPGSAVPTKLRSYGMADIEITDVASGSLLQIAPAHTLTWEVNESAKLQQELATLPSYLLPQLYYLNRTDGLWKVDGTLAYDPNAGLYAATLPHLTNWNIDGALPQNGGCVAGTVVNQCGKPLPTYPVMLWMMEQEEVAEAGTTSDASGDFCMNIPARNIANDPTSNQAVYYLSGKSYDDSASTCRPIPKYCMETMLTMPTFPGSFSDTCHYGPDQDFWPLSPAVCAGNGRSAAQAEPNGIDPAECSDDCAAQNNWVVNIPTCHICPGSGQALDAQVCNASNTVQTTAGCFQLDPLVISDGSACNCTPKAAGDTCKVTADCCNPNLSCTSGSCVAAVAGGDVTTPPPPACTPKTQAASCNEGATPDDCCDAALVCMDYLCVPAVGE